MSAETSTLPSQHSQQQQQQQQQQQLQGITQGNTFPLQSVPMSLPVPLPVALPSQLTAAGGLPFQNASLYVGDLHPDVTDSTLYDIFNAVGPVASIRVCRDALSRKSLGYAYVNFHSPKDAERALDTMNYTLIKDRPCRIMWSQRDPNLRKTGQGNVFVKHLDLSIDNKALYDTFSLFGNILSCKVVTDGQGKSRGYGFVHFETPEAAEDAIKKINGMLIAGKEVFVGRFLKKHDRPTAKDFTNVYVKNLPKQWTKQELEDFFSVCGPIASSIIMTSNNLSPEESKSKSKGFGFIDFAEHEGAENAINKFNGFELIVDEIRDTKEQLTKKENKDVSENSDNIEQNAESQLSQVSQEKDNNNEDNFSEKSTETNIEKLPNGKVKLTLSVCRAQKKSERERELAQKFHELKIERQNKYDGVNLYVKNLDDRVDDEILKHEFASFGNITSARVMRERNSVNNLDNFEQGENVEESDNSNKDSGKVLPPSKGFGFVCYSSPEEAVKAVTEMNGKMLYGKPLYVTLAQRKDQRRVQLESQHRQQQRLLNMGPNLGNNMGNIGGLNNMAGLNGLNNMPGLNNLNMIPGVGNVMNNVNMGGLNNLNNLMMMQNLAAQRGFNNNNNVPNSQNLGAQMFDKPNPKNIIQQPQLGTNNNVGFQGLNNRPSVRPRNINPNFPNNNNSQINQIQGPPPFMARNNNNNIQFNQNARNTNLNMFQQQQQQQQNMPRRPNFAQNNSINNVNSSQGQSLNPALLAQASPEDRKTLIGEQLYPLVARLEPSHSAKITGMLLEMDNPELLHLIESPESLMMKVREAVEILRHAQGNE